MKRLSWFAWAIIVVLTLALGLYAGYKVMKAISDIKVMDLEAELETAQTSLIDLSIEFEQNRVLAHVWTGLCSWYGDRENGRPTASGQIFDMWDLTGASRTIRLGSMIIVENVETGRMVPVLVNDRGPYITGRGLDVSKAVAERLGMLKQGLAKVRVYELVQGRPSVRD